MELKETLRYATAIWIVMIKTIEVVVEVDGDEQLDRPKC